MSTITSLNNNPLSARLTSVQSTTVDAALTAADINFTVAKVELHSPHLTAEGAGVIDFSDHRGIVRDGTTPLAVVSKNYQVIQNHEAFAPIDALIAEGLIDRVVQAGCTDGGKRVFMLAQLSGECRLEDPHNRMLMFTTSHDGSGATTVRAWSERLFCSNQFPVVFGKSANKRRAKATFSVRHTRKALDYLKQMHSVVLSSIKLLDQHELNIEKFMEVQAAQPVIDEFTSRMFPYPVLPERAMVHRSRARDNVTRNRATFQWLVRASSTNENVRGTVAALFNSATEYSDHYSRGQRADRILLGRDVDFKQRAYDLALDLV